MKSSMALRNSAAYSREVVSASERDRVPVKPVLYRASESASIETRHLANASHNYIHADVTFGSG